MSAELLYTSAPQGLKPGSRGFSTVMHTAGLPSNMASRLESLSGYRHVFAPNHPQASSNPVCYSHLKFVVGSKQVSILSRIADYGIDYTQRTNKLAHHVVLESTELPAAGPAWLISQPGFMRNNWNGTCQILPAGPNVPRADASAAVCHNWQAVMGDAGWGGILADAFLSSDPKPTWVIFELHQSPLLMSLIQESIALLSPPDRWRATFSTYVTNLPPEADCKVRCVLAGSDEARQVAARGKVLLLSRPMTLETSSVMIQLARTGQAARSVPAPLPAPVPAPSPRLAPAPTAPDPFENDSADFDQFELQLAEPDVPDTPKRRMPVAPAAPGIANGLKKKRSVAPPPRLTNKQNSPLPPPHSSNQSVPPLMMAMIGLLTLMLVVVTALLVASLRSGGGGSNLAANGSPSGDVATSPAGTGGVNDSNRTNGTENQVITQPQLVSPVPTPEATKPEVIKPEVIKPETPKLETPETPKFETPKPEIPKSIEPEIKEPGLDGKSRPREPAEDDDRVKRRDGGYDPTKTERDRSSKPTFLR